MRKGDALPEISGGTPPFLIFEGEELFFPFFLFAGLGSLMSSHHLIDHRLRRFLIVIEFHGEYALAAGHAAQIGSVAQHFTHGHVGLEFGNAALRVEAQDLAATARTNRR